MVSDTIRPAKRRLKAPGVTLERFVQPRDGISNVRIKYRQGQFVSPDVKEREGLTLGVSERQGDRPRGGRTPIHEDEVVASGEWLASRQVDLRVFC
jgi:hypothetical protein